MFLNQQKALYPSLLPPKASFLLGPTLQLCCCHGDTDYVYWEEEEKPACAARPASPTASASRRDEHAWLTSHAVFPRDTAAGLPGWSWGGFQCHS